MSKTFKDINFPSTYKYSSDSDHIPLEFYELAFPIAKKIDLFLGYFSSNAIKVLSRSFAEFIINGGEIRIVTNHILSLKDKENLVDQTELKNEDKIIDIFQDLEKLEFELHDYGQHFFDCLRYLQKEKRLTIQPVKFNNVDLAHCKRMILFDGFNYISTDGSINFTLAALTKNSESFEVNVPWINNVFNERVDREKENFEKIITQKHPNYRYIDSNEIEVAIYKVGKEKDIQDLLDDSLKIDSSSFGKKVERILNQKKKRFQHKINDLKGLPRFPYEDGPRDYQNLAYEAWRNNDFKGVFAMATGTGKTLTSLNCLLQDFLDNGYYKAVVIVPTISLINQWKEECRRFNFNNIITISSKENWENFISSLNSANKLLDVSFIILITYASFYRKKFQFYFQNLPLDTVLIADEAHNLGSNQVSKILPSIHLQKRIGLSATPERQYDFTGNNLINIFFNDSSPYCFNFSMEEAIQKGYLCKYEYYPHLVKLNDRELEEYIKKSKQLLNYFDPVLQKYKDCKEVEMLLLQRKRIIHKAENKLGIFNKILKKEFKIKGNLKYTLVYVPEGLEANYDDVDILSENEEELRLIDEYTGAVSNIDMSIMVKQFTGGTPNRSEILTRFEQGNIHVLTSMKCLDEGVDVPRSELAIFCSSTGNPRQFIQRRGRILRNHPDKVNAVIHDLVVFPGIEGNEGTFNMERNLFKSELGRVRDFAGLALNSMDAYQALKPALDHFKISLYNK